MSENLIIQESGNPKELTVDALNINRFGGGSENWVPASGEDSHFIKMSIGENTKINATDYGAYAITEVDVTQDIINIETQPDKTKNVIEPRFVSIREGGKSFIISPIKKLRINKQSGGTTDFMPKSDVSTGILYATKRGHYVATDDGYVGYSEVTVSVPESNDGSGIDGGWTDLPDEIRVTNPPHRTEYAEGDFIDYTGIVVTAYKNGQIWSENPKYPNGVIPFSELRFETNQASRRSGGVTLENFKDCFSGGHPSEALLAELKKPFWLQDSVTNENLGTSNNYIIKGGEWVKAQYIAVASYTCDMYPGVFFTLERNGHHYMDVSISPSNITGISDVEFKGDVNTEHDEKYYEAKYYADKRYYTPDPDDIKYAMINEPVRELPKSRDIITDRISSTTILNKFADWPLVFSGSIQSNIFSMLAINIVQGNRVYGVEWDRIRDHKTLRTWVPISLTKNI